MKALASNALYNVCKTLLSSLFPLITFSYASRIFLADGMGKLDFSKAVVSFFVLFATSGITNYGTREASKVRDNRKTLSKLSQELLTIQLSMGVFAYLLFGGMLLLVPGWKLYHTLMLINSISIILNVIGMEWLYNAVEDFRYIAVRTTVMQVACLIAMLIFVKTGQDLWKYALILVLANSGNSVVNLVHSRKYIDYRPIPKLELKKHIRPIACIFSSWIFIQVYTILDTVMLGVLTNDTIVGLYTASHKISSMGGTVITSATMVLMPRISYYCERGNRREIQTLVRDALGFLLMIAIPGMVGLMMISQETLLLFSGKSFLLADATTKIMALRVLLVPLNTFFVIHLFISMRRDRECITCTAAAAALNFVLNLILIPYLAQNGAAIATVAAEAIELVVNIYFLRKLVPVGQLTGSILQFMLSCIPIVLIAMIGRHYIMQEMLRMVVVVLGSVMLYIACLLGMRNRECVQAVRQLLKFKKI